MSVLKHNKIVIGGTLPALMTAFIEDCPILFTEPMAPKRFDHLDPRTKLDFLKIPHSKNRFYTFNKKINVGIKKLLLWERLLFLLSLRGLVPLSNLCTRMRHIDSRIICYNDYSKIMELKFEKCLYFGDRNASGFVTKTKFDADTYLCYDYIAFNKGGKHEIDFIHTGDDFISEIWFYSSDRIDGNTPVRDACAVSKLTSEQLNDFDFSETMARFKVMQIMKDNGMRGPQNGYTKNGTPRHYNFRTSCIRREIRSFENQLRPSAENIEIKKENEKALHGALKGSIGPYNTILELLDENSP
tara:strand:- start:1446 stop:2345 length:900 start_codon:yes stop_codon:yes gene_type:complete